MKKFLYKITLLSVALLFSAAAAQADDLVRNKHKVFKVQKGHTFIIDTRFSEINIVKNTSDEIDINVTIEVDGNSRRDQALFKDLKVNIEQNGNEVSLITDFPTSTNLSDLNLIIKVKMPTYMQLESEVGYSNFYIEELSGEKNTLNVKYSNFKADVIASANNVINFSYVDEATFGYLNNAIVKMSYSEISMKKVSELTGRSAYSEFEIEEIDQIMLTMTKYDEWNIGKIIGFSATSRYSEIDIGYLSKSIVLDANFGELDIEETGAKFDKINLDIKYTDCDLNIDESASYHLKADASFADIDMEKSRFKGSYHSKMMSLKLDGTIGSNPTGKVTIETSYGDVDL